MSYKKFGALSATGLSAPGYEAKGCGHTGACLDLYQIQSLVFADSGIGLH